MKKTWQSPQLIVLTRSKPEEAVLGGCKTLNSGPGSPALSDGMCDVVNLCNQCDGIVSS